MWKTEEQAGPRGAERLLATLARTSRGTGILAVILLAVSAVLILRAPIEVMGEVQKIFYGHVASAWTSFLAFTVTCGASALFLLTRERTWDELAAGAAEIGMVFLTLVLVTGPIWARPAWGTWWMWSDARLTTSLILWFMYLGYLLIRPFADESERGARNAAVFGIVAYADVPIVHFAVQWWAGFHPNVVDPAKGLAAPPQMAWPLAVTVIAFMVLFVHLLGRRVNLEHARHRLEDHELEASTLDLAHA